MKYYTTKTRKYTKGQMIFSENSECDGMYIINSGRVRVFKTVENEGGGHKDVDLCSLGPKAMFGEMGLIDNNRRSASVQAVEATECTVIMKKVFEEQLSRIPPWMVNMIRILVQRLRETNEKLRKTVACYTTLPNDDTGSMLTIDEKTSQKFGKESFDIPLPRDLHDND